jgi:hypothetical protein
VARAVHFAHQHGILRSGACSPPVVFSLEPSWF